MIRPCTDADFDTIYSIINDAAEAYRGVIPADRWHEPYMPKEELRHEIESGVRFWGYEEDGELLGVMGIQDVQDVTLIRHAYVRTAKRGQGIGGKLLAELRKLTNPPGPHRHLGGGDLGDPVLREARLPAGHARGEGSAAEEVLVDPRAAGGDFGGAGGGMTEWPTFALGGAATSSTIRLRRLLHNPEKIVGPYVQPGMTVMDVGCGMGMFSIAMAKMVGEQGRVIAVDLQQKMLDVLRRRAERAGVADRIQLHKCEQDRLGVDAQVDFALAFMMVHEVPDQRRLLGEIHGCLKPGGKLLVAEPRLHVSGTAFGQTVAGGGGRASGDRRSRRSVGAGR